LHPRSQAGPTALVDRPRDDQNDLAKLGKQAGRDGLDIASRNLAPALVYTTGLPRDSEGQPTSSTRTPGEVIDSLKVERWPAFNLDAVTITSGVVSAQQTEADDPKAATSFASTGPASISEDVEATFSDNQGDSQPDDEVGPRPAGPQNE